MTIENVVAELYGLDPGQFTAARNARVEQARAAGDNELATAIGKLRRPTVAAWTVNLLARHASEDVNVLIDLGAALRDAQRRLSGAQLRTLTTQRQQVVNALSRKAGELAAAQGHRVGESVLRDVGQTLHAALADPEAADRVRTGTLTTAASYEGFGPAGPTLVPETAGERAPKKAPPKPKGTAARTEAARRELDEALEALESARKATDSARNECDRAATDATALDTRIAGLRTELDRAEEQRRFARATERAARESLHQAERQLERLQRRADEARARAEST